MAAAKKTTSKSAPPAAQVNDMQKDAESLAAEKAEVITALAAPSSPTTALAASDEEDYGDMSGDAEGLTADDLLISRYRCVQKMTRAVGKANPTVVEGNFYNTMTKRGQESAVVVAMCEVHHIVEREAANPQKFIQSLPLNDKRVRAALKANNNSYIKLMSIDKDPPTKLNETRDVHVCFLDELDGVTPRGFGVLQFDSTNLTPGKVWKNERANCCMPTQEGGKQRPVYAFRARVSCEVKDNSQSQQPNSMIFKIEPWKDGNWDASALRMSVPAEKALLFKLAAHKKLVESGLLKTDYRQEDGPEESESDAEDASFDPEDDGRVPVAAGDGPSFDD